MLQNYLLLFFIHFVADWNSCKSAKRFSLFVKLPLKIQILFVSTFSIFWAIFPILSFLLFFIKAWHPDYLKTIYFEKQFVIWFQLHSWSSFHVLQEVKECWPNSSWISKAHICTQVLKNTFWVGFDPQRHVSCTSNGNIITYCLSK